MLFCIVLYLYFNIDYEEKRKHNLSYRMEIQEKILKLIRIILHIKMDGKRY